MTGIKKAPAAGTVKGKTSGQNTRYQTYRYLSIAAAILVLPWTIASAMGSSIDTRSRIASGRVELGDSQKHPGSGFERSMGAVACGPASGMDSGSSLSSSIDARSRIAASLAEPGNSQKHPGNGSERSMGAVASGSASGMDSGSSLGSSIDTRSRIAASLVEPGNSQKHTGNGSGRSMGAVASGQASGMEFTVRTGYIRKNCILIKYNMIFDIYLEK